MIRNMLPEDRQEYLRLSGIFYSSDAVAYAIPKAQYEKTFNELITGNPYLRGLMIECKGEIAGFALLALTYSNEAGGMVVWLEELFILPEFQGRGLGSEFFSFVDREYAGKATRFRLEVAKNNTRAADLYRRLGFEEFPYLQMAKELK